MAVAGATPTRKTSEHDLSAFNEQWRQTPEYTEALRMVGADPTRAIKLSDKQQKTVEGYLKSKGVQLPKGMKIDNAGNFNQTNEAWKRTGRVAAIAGAGALMVGTAGAASPAMAALLGGVEGAGVGYGTTGTVKGTLIGAAGGAATGGLLHGGGGAGHASTIGSGVEQTSTAVPNLLGAAGAEGGAFYGAAAPSLINGVADVAAGSVPALASGGGPGSAAFGGAAPIGADTIAGPLTAEQIGTVGATGAGKSIWGQLGDAATDPDTWRAAGGALSGYADASAANRGAQVEAAAVAERLNQDRQHQFTSDSIAREDSGMKSGADAWKKMQQAEYLANAEGYKAPNLTLQSGGHAQLADFGFGPKAATDTEKLGAASYRDEAMNRLQGGNPIAAIANPGEFKFDPNLLKAGLAERLTGAAGTGASIWGLLNDVNKSRQHLT